jgi:hypothetical protein
MDESMELSIDVDGDGVADITVPVKPSWFKRIGLVIVGLFTWLCSGGQRVP